MADKHRITEFFYIFEVYNFAGWSTDGGSSLHHEEKGCGALTGWVWNEQTDTHRSSAYFNLPFLMKDGCVERAIVSAGGPKLSCEFQDYDFFKKKRSAAIDPPPPAPSLSRLHRRDLISDTPRFPSGLLTTPSNNTGTATTAPLYTPESWGPGNTETFTTTIEETSKSTYTTEIVLATGAGRTTGTNSTTTATKTATTTTTSSQAISTGSNGQPTPLPIQARLFLPL